jgi:hypothetical protein
MKTASAIFFTLATIVAGSTLSAVSSYAQTYSSDQQACGYSNDGDCPSKTSHNMAGPVHVSHDRARADDHARSNGRAQ